MELVALEKLVEQWVQTAFAPLRSFFEIFGYSPLDVQIYTFLIAVFWICLTAPEFYGSYILRRRRSLTRGRVVDIDESGDEPNAIIEFPDNRGQVQRFASTLVVTGRTNHVGAVVDIIYDPLQPKRARETNRPFAQTFRMVCLALPTLGLLVFSFWPELSLS